MSDLDPDSLSKLLVRDLKEHLSNRGLSTVGLKAELVKRLREAILLEQNENNCENDPEKTDEEPMDMDKDESSPEQFQSEEEKESSHDQLEEEASLAEEQRTEEQAQLQAEEQARILAEEQARLQAEEEARLHAEEKARIQAEQARIQAEQARIQAEEQARIQAENEARIQAENEARIQAEEEARIQAEERARLHAEKQARLQAEEEARLQAEEEARLYAEEQARLQAEEQAQLQAEEARLQAEKQARLLAEEEARLRAEEARLQAEEQARLLAEEEARLRAEEEARIHAEEKARLQAEERARIQAEEKARLQAEERARLRAQELARLRAEEEARLRAEEEAHLRAKEEARQEAEKARIFEERNYQSISEERANDEYSNEMFVDNSIIVSENDKREQERTSEDIERKAREEEMRVEQERWLVEEQMRKVQEEHKKRLKAEEERRKKKDLERSSQEEQNRVLEEKIKSASQKRFLEEQRQTTEETSETNESILMEEDIRLPQAIEKVLALKSERAQELGIDPDTGMRPETAIKGKASNIKSTSVALVTVDEDDVEDDESLVKSKESKKRRRKRKKKTKLNDSQGKRDLRQSEKPSKEMNVDVDIEYVQEVIDITDPMYGQFMKIFERFKLTDVDKEKEEAAANAITDIAKETLNPMAFRKKPMDLDDDDDDKDDEKVEEEKPKLSKRKLKKLNRMSVAELKQKVNRPELVEMHDVTAKDPLLLLHLKASRNTVPVPRHWCFKRKYLQGKRGIEKPAFELPDFIKRTGIMEMRQALQEKEDQKTMKAKMRERVRPKLGKIDIDYQKLHDAFFKWQTKPKMTIHGDLYYEGKEFETRLKEKKPGDLSEDLRTALGMPTGTNAQKCPPPWLIAMQRYGPPPSYPNLKIPGLNAPIPEDCSFGYHAGGWGKPPVDEAGRPLYGDVFGTQVADNLPHIQEEEIDHTLWGELESESSEEEEDEEEEEEEDDEEEKVEDETGLVTPAEGLITPSGFSSIPAGMETPDMIELRKRKIESEIEGGETPALYTILPEKKTDRVGAAMMASTHVYDMSNTIPASKLKMQAPTSAPSQGIEVALDPSELEMDSAAMAARYEQTMREQQSQLEKEDLSDMVAEHAARQKNKRKKQQLTSTKPPKKYKEFKF